MNIYAFFEYTIACFESRNRHQNKEVDCLIIELKSEKKTKSIEKTKDL